MEWVPAITSTSILVLLLWLSRRLIEARLKNSVRHEYDVKLKEFDEKLKAEIRKKETQIDALRSGALENIVGRHSALYQRKLGAVETVWSGIVKLQKLKNMSRTLCSFKYDAVAEESKSNPQLREIFTSLGTGLDIDAISTPEVDCVRPFLSTPAWAYFSAYRSIGAYYYTKLKMLESGLGEFNVTDDEHIKNLIRTALPHQGPVLEKHGPDSFYVFFDELENRILEELDSTILGKESNRDTLDQAVEVLKASEELAASSFSSIVK